MVRQVLPSAPPEQEPPQGIFVLEGFSVPGDPVVRDLRLFLTRPGVVRLVGQEPALDRLCGALTGRLRAVGIASAGGVDRSMTPVLFERHLRVGLQDPPDPSLPGRQWYLEEGRRRGVPPAVVQRRLQADLGWMGPRLDRPVQMLAPLDRWKLRLAVAFLDRPSVLVLWTRHLPASRDPVTQEAVRRVLAAVGRHYRAVVLLLDPGSPVPSQVVRSWSHEEVRLGSDGFHERSLLHEGRRITNTTDPSLFTETSRGASDGGRNGRRSRSAPGPRATRRK